MLTDQATVALITEIGAVMVCVLTGLFSVAIARINGRVNRVNARLKKVEKENRDWHEWADKVTALLPEAIRKTLPPRPRHSKAEEDE